MCGLRTGVLAGVLAAAAWCGGCGSGERRRAEEETKRLETDFKAHRDAIGAVLNQMHAAAGRADHKAYMECFAPDAVFIGTDATERWNMGEFSAYAKHYFDQGKGWLYVPQAGKRNVTLDMDANAAWFDELLMSEKYGLCRGTGAARRVGGKWQVVQYSLSFPIPNDLAGQVTGLIKGK